MQVGLSRGTRSKTVPVVVLLAGILTITCRRNYATAPNSMAPHDLLEWQLLHSIILPEVS